MDAVKLDTHIIILSYFTNFNIVDILLYIYGQDRRHRNAGTDISCIKVTILRTNDLLKMTHIFKIIIRNYLFTSNLAFGVIFMGVHYYIENDL